MAVDTALMVEALFHGVLLREPTTIEAAYCQEQLDLDLVTPAGMVFSLAATEEFSQVSFAIAAMFQAALGRYGTTAELMAWRRVYDTGMSLSGIGQSFMFSSEIRESAVAPVSTADFLGVMAVNGLGRTLTALELEEIVPLVDSGAVTYGDLLQALIQLNGRTLHVGLAMLSTGLNGAVPEEVDLDALGTDIPQAVSEVVLNSIFYATPTSNFSENGGYMEVSGEFTDDLMLDLYNNTLTIGGVGQVLTYGTMADVVSVDASGISGSRVIFTGGVAAETYVASNEGDSIRGRSSADSLRGGDGADTFVFEASAFVNGVDSIGGFLRGENKDVLDFSSFLNVTGSGNTATVDAGSIAPIAWENGDVLVVSGYGLTTASAIANLFGDDKPFAAPSGSGKAVLISSDIVGDASVWYIVNQVETSSIAASEIAKVAVLAGVNNLELVGFEASNFA